jgi:hypothetical protein
MELFLIIYMYVCIHLVFKNVFFFFAIPTEHVLYFSGSLPIFLTFSFKEQR